MLDRRLAALDAMVSRPFRLAHRAGVGSRPCASRSRPTLRPMGCCTGCVSN
jgi:hypothetical protein